MKCEVIQALHEGGRTLALFDVRQQKNEDILALEPNKAAYVEHLLFGPTYYEIQT